MLSAAPTKPNRIRWILALRAFYALATDPANKGSHGAVFVHATEGRSGQRAFARLATSEAGRTLLETHPNLRDCLVDRANLEKLPLGTLGRAYAALLIDAGATLEETEELASTGVVRSMTAEERWFTRRQEQIHDLRHIVTAYATDDFGELCLLAFRYAQTRHPGMGFLCLAWSFKLAHDLRGQPVRAALHEAYRRGRQSAWQDDLPWEQLLAEPLASVRAYLKLELPAIYQQIHARCAEGVVPSAAPEARGWSRTGWTKDLPG